MSITHKLGKEATAWELSGYVKDLKCLNRNLSKVVCIDFDINNVKYTPSNVVIIPEFNGDSNDKELLQLTQFLKDLSKPNIKDVRKTIEKYGNFKPHLKYYKENPKYHKLLPKDNNMNDDEDIKAIRNNK